MFEIGKGASLGEERERVERASRREVEGKKGREDELELNVRFFLSSRRKDRRHRSVR